MTNTDAKRCPRCGGQLFLESESLGNHTNYLWECSLGCSRQFRLDGNPVSYMAAKRRVKVVRELIPASKLV